MQFCYVYDVDTSTPSPRLLHIHLTTGKRYGFRKEKWLEIFSENITIETIYRWCIENQPERCRGEGRGGGSWGIDRRTFIPFKSSVSYPTVQYRRNIYGQKSTVFFSQWIVLLLKPLCMHCSQLTFWNY